MSGSDEVKAPVIFSNYDVVEPDLLYVSNERAAKVLRDYLPPRRRIVRARRGAFVRGE